MGICSSGGNTDQFDLNLLNYAEEARCFYVICTVFNPARSKTKIRLYSNFKKQMEKYGARLITVECAYENSPYTITQPNYEPYNIQVRTYSSFFQKEALIELAVSKLPHDAKYIAWIDYEIEFMNSNWLNDAIKTLNIYKIAQLFDEISFINNINEEYLREKGFASQLWNSNNSNSNNNNNNSTTNANPNSKTIIDKKVFQNNIINNSGYAWGIRKETYKELNGLIDCNILGNGDKILAYCLAGKINEYIPDNLTETYKNILKNWQKKACETLGQGSIGFIPGIIKVYNSINQYSSMYNKKEKKNLNDRWDILVNNSYDPKHDLIKDKNGLYEITLNKPKLIDELKNLFDAIHSELHQE